MLSFNAQLRKAARDGVTENVRQCLSQEACDPLDRDKLGRSALIWACVFGQEDCVTLLLPRSDPLIQDNNGHSALMRAARFGHEDCVKLLLPHSDPLARDNIGYSALMEAASNGHEACVKLLLPGSDILAKSGDGLSASEMSMEQGYVSVAETINAYALAKKEETELAEHVPSESTHQRSKTRI